MKVKDNLGPETIEFIIPRKGRYGSVRITVDFKKSRLQETQN